MYKPLEYRLKNPRILLLDLFSLVQSKLDDITFIRIKYWIIFGKRINFSNPKTFNEKLQYLKLKQRDNNLTKLVDKNEVKDYISRFNLVEVIPTLNSWSNVDEINWDTLPNQFVLKTTHDSGGVVVCKNKSTLDVESAKNKLTKSLHHDYYMSGREWPYKNVVPKIIAEKHIEDESGELRDFKFFCFNGVVQFFKVDFNRAIDHHANYYDCNMNLLSLGEVACPPDPNHKVSFPKNMKEMISAAEQLSVGFPFVRVDLYNVNGSIYFGELTFYPASGFGRFTDSMWDSSIGSMLDLDGIK